MATNRREFLVNLSAASIGVLAPGVVLGAEPRYGFERRLVFDRWSDGPWPGLKIRCLQPEGEFKGYNIGCQYYLEHPGDMVVRLCFGLELYEKIERGEHIPQIGVDDCRPEFREKIREDMMKAWEGTCQWSDMLLDHGSMSKVNHERNMNFPVLLRHRADVQITGPEDLFAKYDAEIPSSWERVRT